MFPDPLSHNNLSIPSSMVLLSEPLVKEWIHLLEKVGTHDWACSLYFDMSLFYFSFYGLHLVQRKGFDCFLNQGVGGAYL